MDFLDPNKKRSNRIKLLVGYILVAVAIAMGSLVLLFALWGYDFDKDGSITRNSLVFVESRPIGANFTLNNTRTNFSESGTTAAKLTVNEGTYKLTINKEGYREWQREFIAEGGQVTRIVYPLLFPNNLLKNKVQDFESKPSIVTQSPDRQRLVISDKDSIQNFTIYNLRGDQNTTTKLTLPEPLLTKSPTSSLEVIEWSNDNKNFLAKHSYDGKSEFVIINIDEPAKSLNINNLIGQTPVEASLSDKEIKKLYLLMPGDSLLQTLDVETKVLTPIAVKVLKYKSHGEDMIVYFTPTKDDPTQVDVVLQTDEKKYTLRKLPANTNYVADLAEFDGDWYVIVGAESENRTYLYRNPIDSLENKDSDKPIFARTMIIDSPKHVSFSANARMIAVQSGRKFVVFDAEYDQQFRYVLEKNISLSKPVEWMDGHRLKTSYEGQGLVFDFDGVNEQTLVPTIDGLDLMFDRDYEFMYNLEKNDNNSFTLNRTKLYID